MYSLTHTISCAPSHTHPYTMIYTTTDVIYSSMAVAFIAVLETLISARLADEMTKTHHDRQVWQQNTTQYSAVQHNKTHQNITQHNTTQHCTRQHDTLSQDTLPTHPNSASSIRSLHSFHLIHAIHSPHHPTPSTLLSRRYCCSGRFWGFLLLISLAGR